MLFTNVLTYALVFASATPMVAALYHWDEKLQLYTLGEVPAPHWNHPKASAEWMGQCNGGDIPEGGYGCGTFIEDYTVIYQCQEWKDGTYWLKKVEVCAWMNKAGGQCVRNQLKMGPLSRVKGRLRGKKDPLAGKKFYPEKSGDMAVCVQPEVLGGKPWVPKPEN